MKLFRVIIKQLITEKTSALELDQNCYVLQVSKDATKIDIKNAVKEIYGSEVASVRMLHTREKFKFGKKGMQIRKRSTKKAYVTLKKDSPKLDISLVK